MMKKVWAMLIATLLCVTLSGCCCCLPFAALPAAFGTYTSFMPAVDSDSDYTPEYSEDNVTTPATSQQEHQEESWQDLTTAATETTTTKTETNDVELDGEENATQTTTIPTHATAQTTTWTTVETTRTTQTTRTTRTTQTTTTESDAMIVTWDWSEATTTTAPEEESGD